jgi:protein-S-isoprenylcysteine O-methyltransferase Ste14
MLSPTLVSLQIALMVAIAVPFDVRAWNARGMVLVAIAAAVGVWTLTVNRLGNFNIRPEPKQGGRLVTDGPYRCVRHPMYLAVLVGTAGFCAAYGTPWRWAALAVLMVVLHVKAGVEERHLAARHPGYADYARGRKRFIPFLW